MIERFVNCLIVFNSLLVISKGIPLKESLPEGLPVKCGSTKDLGPNETIVFESSGRDPCRLRLIANRCRVGIQCQSRSLWGKSLSNGECVNILELTGEDGIEKICLDGRQSKSINIRGPTISLNLAPPNVNRISQPVNLFQALTQGTGLSRCSLACQRVDVFGQPQRNDQIVVHNQKKTGGTKTKRVSPILGNGMRATECECGRRPDHLVKIVNGVETESGEIPFQVGLVGKGRTRPYCGGSIINSRYILTAAHCVIDNRISPDNIEVLVNEYNVQTEDERNTTRMQVDTILINPSYNYRESRLFTGAAALNGPIPNDYDAALLRLVEPIDMSETPPVCLPFGMRHDYRGMKAVVSGWGRTSESDPPSPILRKTEIQVLSNSECARTYFVPRIISERMLCATGPNTDSCFGDSGGPLALNVQGKYTQIGIVSWGLGCARSFPGVYSRVSEFMPWIAQHTKDGSFCTH